MRGGQGQLKCWLRGQHTDRCVVIQTNQNWKLEITKILEQTPLRINTLIELSVILMLGGCNVQHDPSTILRLNWKVNVTTNVTNMNWLPKHIFTTRQQFQNEIRSHMANRTKTAVATASRSIENHERRISTQTIRQRLKAV